MPDRKLYRANNVGGKNLLSWLIIVMDSTIICDVLYWPVKSYTQVCLKKHKNLVDSKMMYL